MNKHTQRITLEKKVILLTGGYGYLGVGIANSLKAHGAEVYILGRHKEKFDEAFPNDNMHFVPCDVSSTSSVEIAFSAVIDKAGKIDVLINNAFFLSGAKDQENIDDQIWNHSIDGTLNSVHRCIRTSIPYLKETQGNIINVSSMYGIQAPDFDVYKDCIEYTNPAFYGAAKAGVVQLTKYYASLLGKYSINVNAVCPGPFPSPEVQKNSVFVENLKSKTALKRIGKQNEIGGPFVFLSSDASSFITGHNLVIDGGWTIK